MKLDLINSFLYGIETHRRLRNELICDHKVNYDLWKHVEENFKHRRTNWEYEFFQPIK